MNTRLKGGSTEPIIVIDNGAWDIKFGYAGKPDSLKVVGNYVAKAKTERKRFVGDISEVRDKSTISFTRPHDKGFVVNWDLEHTIWETLFKAESAPNSHLLVTTPPFTPDTLLKLQTEVIFEDYGFQSYFSTSAPFLSMYNAKHTLPDSPCHLIVDTGYSFTHCVPFFDQQKLNYAIKRCSVGGKVMTNYLKEIISYRHWNMNEEPYLVNLLKEKLCYVSLDFRNDLLITKKKGEDNTIKLDYVLPDYITSQEGYIKPQEIVDVVSIVENKEQILTMNNERITIPEILFHPSDAGIKQAGIAESIVQSVQSCHSDLHGLLYSNIVVTGGNTKIKNFKERLEREVRQMCPEEYEVKITIPENPMHYAWHGGCKFASSPMFSRYAVTKQQYEEFGHNLCKRRFFN